jgi:hypothetical protein
MAVSLEQVLDRLRVWSARAAHEVENSSGAIATSWKGQQRVLGAVTKYMQGEGARYSPNQVRLRLIEDSGRARLQWEASKNEREVAELAGEVAAYELVLTLLKEAGPTWNGVAGD